ncbi:hypothetical protein [Nocardia carnea]|uniref:hypothetical protein n=1 Tax=Nocardia carnea TaxID=37328 RepID=UPI002458CAC2|nr:hypothetical protein [Nocardia carnea]
MSTDFTVHLELPFPAGILMPTLADIRWRGDAPGDPVNAPGTWYPYREGISTRVLTVAWSDDTLEVTLPAASAPEDLDLALRILRAAAHHAGGDVDTEYGTLPPGELTDAYNEDWALHQLGRSVSMVAQLSERSGGVISLPGPNRDVALGPRSLPGLAQGDERTRGRRLLELMRRVQWPDPRYDPAGVFQASKDDEKFTFAVLLSERACLMPAVDRILVRDSAHTVLQLPRAALEKLPIEHTRLDDGNDLVEFIPEEDWPGVVSAARELVVP